MRLARAKWRAKNPNYQKEYSKENRDKYNGYSKKHYQENKEKLIPYINAHRKGRLKDATPLWANKRAIRYFYVNCPEGYHVDHIIPLRGKFVSGLHVLENLQYLPAQINLQKGNRIALHET